MALTDEINDFVTYIQDPIVFPGILQFNVNAHIQTLHRTNTKNRITAYNLFRKRIFEEASLINVTDFKVIGFSTNIIWRRLTTAERTIFHNYARQILSIIDIRN
ncbi:7090_t:CDS:1 [Dentiscutata erythropus]|uniref:7090_t:CDS:1 n=1 Tax=Dentiscutata erythropus TaxID=1348616 RepID=A0A9N9I6N6_9GLOM|nr:7090_t:CDS:1 [Dentiscutata erythropus]